MINADFEDKYPILLQMVEQELDKAKIVFDEQMTLEAENRQQTSSGKNMPLVAGTLNWAQQLRKRYQSPIGSLRLSVNLRCVCCFTHLDHWQAPAFCDA